MKEKKVLRIALTIIMVVLGIIMFCACNNDSNQNEQNGFEIPEFSTVDEMLKVIDEGKFKFSSLTFEVEEFDANGTRTNKIVMKCDEAMTYSVSETQIMSITSTVKSYTIPDINDNCIYMIINTPMAESWNYSKTALTFDDYNGKNFAALTLKSYIETNSISKELSTNVNNNVISFGNDDYKFTIYDFNATTVQLEESLKDYKSKC